MYLWAAGASLTPAAFYPAFPADSTHALISTHSVALCSNSKEQQPLKKDQPLRRITRMRNLFITGIALGAFLVNPDLQSAEPHQVEQGWC